MTLWGGGTGQGWVSPARVAARGRCDGGPQAASGASKSKSRRSTFGYIVKPEVVAIGGRRRVHHGSTT